VYYEQKKQKKDLSTLSQDHMKEMIRIHDLWQDTKQDLRETKRTHTQLLKEYEQEVRRTEQQHAQIVHGYKEELTSLRAELAAKDARLANLAQEGGTFSKTCDELHAQLSQMHEKYAAQVNDNMKLAAHVRQYEERVQSLRVERATTTESTIQGLRMELRTAQQSVIDLQNELTIQGRKIGKQVELIDLQATDIQNLKSVQTTQNELLDSNAGSRSAMTAKLTHQNEIIAAQERELERMRARITEMKQLEGVMETQALGEFRRSRKEIEQRLDQLQTDCAQVATLLVPPSSSSSKKQKKSASNSSLPDDWMPASMQQLINDFKYNMAKSGSGSPAQHISRFLITLNRIWRERLFETTRDLKRRHMREVRELKRKLLQRIPYQQVVQRARIQRLQKNLDHERTVHLKSKGQANQGLLALSLNTVEDLSRQVIDFEQQNNYLRGEIDTLVDERNLLDDSYKSTIAWVYAKLMESVNALGDKMWKLGNSYVDKAIRLSRQADFIPRLSEECQLMLDSVEADVRHCKSAVKRAMADVEANPNVTTTRSHASHSEAKQQ
jgi:chromosome segregation ATPase